jgi:osmoprotectant transport system ATP-binding protein
MIRAELQDDLKGIFLSLKKTVVLVTHDLSEAAFFADTIILMHNGRVVQLGHFRDLIDHPEDSFVGQFVHAQLRRLAAINEQAVGSKAGRA